MPATPRSPLALTMDNSNLSDEPYPGDHYEYQTVGLRGEMVTALNALGYAGWQACAVSAGAPNPVTGEPTFQVLLMRKRLGVLVTGAS